MKMNIFIQKLHASARIPSYAHDGDAGMDIYSVETVTIEPQEIKKIKTGIAIALPHGHVGLIWDKSGMSMNHGLKVLGGVIDSGYRGEVIIGLINLGRTAYTCAAGDKIAQLLVQTVCTKDAVTLCEVQSLDDTARGKGGFGSTGK